MQTPRRELVRDLGRGEQTQLAGVGWDDMEGEEDCGGPSPEDRSGFGPLPSRDSQVGP